VRAFRLLLAALCALLLPPAAAQARVVVVAGGDPRATLVDVRTNAIVAQPGVPGRARAAAASPDGSRAYVAGGRAVVAIDLMTRRPAGSALLGSTATGLATSPDGARLYALQRESIAVLDAAGPSLLGSISLPRPSLSLAISPDGTRALAVMRGGTVALVDLVAGRVIRRLSVAGATDADFDLTGRGWISSQIGPEPRRKEPKARKKRRAPRSAAVRPGGRLVPLDPVAARLGAAVPLGDTGGGGGVAVSPDGRRAFVAAGAPAKGRARRAAVVDLGSRQVIARPRTGIGPGAPAWSPEGARVYVTDRARAPCPSSRPSPTSASSASSCPARSRSDSPCSPGSH
jgi:DNA-binding beta-propeller fold protein YncE